jgi:hypothetical protein
MKTIVKLSIQIVFLLAVKETIAQTDTTYKGTLPNKTLPAPTIPKPEPMPNQKNTGNPVPMPNQNNTGIPDPMPIQPLPVLPQPPQLQPQRKDSIR